MAPQPCHFADHSTESPHRYSLHFGTCLGAVSVRRVLAYDLICQLSLLSSISFALTDGVGRTRCREAHSV
jgi:hypothetical protein